MENEDLRTDEYIVWVMTILDQYKTDVNMIHDKEIPPWEIQRLLGTFQTTLYGLIAEYQRNKRSIATYNRKFKTWWNTKVSDARRELLATLPAGKFPAQKEYAIIAEETNKIEYDEWQEKIQDAQDKTDFMKSMVESWNSFLNVVINLNKNMTAELRSLGVDSIEIKPKTREPRK